MRLKKIIPLLTGLSNSIFVNPFTARVNVGVLDVVLTFESVDKIL